MGTELEQKYVVESPRPWAVQTRLLSQLSRAGYQVSFLEEKPQRDTYFDTPEESILKGGGSLRLREKGKKNLLSVKAAVRSEGGTFLRREDELVLGREADPMAFLRTYLPGVDLESLTPTAVVVNRRRTYEVSRTAGGRFELAFDDVCYRDPATGREHRERQVELEALSGTEADLARVVSALRLPELRPASESKYQRAVRLTAAGGPAQG